MRNELRKTYKLANELFPGISDFCKRCKTCCKTYGWLLEEEAKEFSKRGFPLVKINDSLYCIDSFKRDNKGELILDHIPRCRFYRKGSCSIYKLRPLDCRLFPIKVKFFNRKSVVGISLGCKYVSFLTDPQLKRISKRVINFFQKAPNKVIADYLNLMNQVTLISKPKKFWMEKLIEFDRIGPGKNWDLTKIFL